MASTERMHRGLHQNKNSPFPVIMFGECHKYKAWYWVRGLQQSKLEFLLSSNLSGWTIETLLSYEMTLLCLVS